ncbi:MAG: proprotein convertase P-domain-containing protein, partial [Anaerolineales bacterium]|nr:proprotein convertase P-domain-containing protein [Anaerolineales bacterium]
ANSVSRSYGAANPSFTAVYTGFVNGDTAGVLSGALTVTATQTTPIGAYAIASTLASPNYTVTYVPGTLTITPAPLTIAANSVSRSYGAANPSFTAVYTGFVNGETAAVLSGALTVTATETTPAGAYAIASTLAGPNYAVTYVPGALTVTPAPLTVTANNQSKAYGAVLPALTVGYSGFVNGETLAVLDVLPTAGTTATQSSPAGTYAITASGGADANYTFSYVPGTLTVNPVPLTVTADNQSRFFGQANPAFTATYTGFVLGESAVNLASPAVFTTTAVLTSELGAYPIVASGAASPNYTITFVDGVLSIVEQPIAGLTAGNASPTLLGQSTSFTSALAAGTHVAYQWAFGDGGSAAGASAAHTYAEAGFYTATLTATNSIGTAVATTPVTVTNPLPTLTQISPLTRTLDGPAFTLTLTGTNFVSGARASVVRWNGADRPTTVVSGTRLTAAIPASDLTAAGPAALTVFNPAPGGGLSGAQTLTVAPWPAIAISDVTLTETTGAPASAVFTVTLSGYTDQPAVVTYTTAPLTAQAGTDYTTTTGALTFAPGVTTQVIQVPVVGDALDEFAETFAVNLTGASFATLADAQGLGTIQDDDLPPTLAFLAATQTITEPASAAASVGLTLTLSAPSGLTITVPYTVSGTAANSGLYLDHTLTDGVFVLPPLAATQVFTFNVLADALDEDTESMVVTLGAADFATPGGQLSHAVTIEDNPGDTPPTLAFNPLTVTVNEDSGPAVLIGQLSAISGRVVTATYSTTAGSAASGVDFPSASGTLTLPAYTLTATLPISVTPDNIYESPEAFTVRFNTAPNAALVTASRTATVTVANDDPLPGVRFQSSAYLGSEGTSAPITVTLTNPSAFTITAAYATSDGTAQLAQNDYTPASGTLTFPPLVTSQTFSVQLLDDIVDELDESVNLTLSSPVSATISGTNPATLVIADTDGAPNIGFLQPAFTVDEDSGPALVVVSMLPASAFTVTVNVTSADGTASRLTDYAVVSRTLSIPGGQSRTGASFTIPITVDATFEADETFTLTLSSPVSATLSPFLDEAVVTILNDDPLPQVKLSAPGFRVTENRGPAVITATLDRPSAFPVLVTLQTSDDTALAAADYRAQTTPLTFPAGVTLITTTVPITDDGVYEGNEAFTVALAGVSGATLGAPSSAAVVIVENDAPPVIQFSAAAYAAAENAGAAVITATITGARAVPAAVTFATADLSARAGSDYTARLGQLVFAPADTALTFTVPITDEGVYEGNESLALALSAPISATLAGGNPVTLTLQEVTLAPQVDITSVSVAEGNAGTTSAVFTVTLTGPTALTATVAYQTANGTAQAGTDYQPGSGTLSFPAGTTTRTIAVPVTGETLYEAAETFTVSLSSLVNARAGTLSGLGTILNDDQPPTVNLSAASYVVGEKGATLVITVSLSAASALPAQVSANWGGGTATAGQDYTAGGSSLNFAPGVTLRTFNVPILDDTVYEDNETFTVTLSAPSGLQLGAVSAAGVIIAENDPHAGCFIFNSTDLPKAIPDATPGGVESQLILPGPGLVISDVNVRIDTLRHSYTGDLRVYLIAPNGQSLVLIGDPGGVGQHGDGDDLLYTVLDDSAPLGWTSNPAPPFTGAFTPYTPLAALNNRASAGTWKLKVVDAVGGDTGSLQAWGLEICGTVIPDTGGPPYKTYLALIRR